MATPIGNLSDMSFRAVDVLKQADLILCEDTRTSSKLLNYYNISKPLRAYHDHSKDHDRDAIISELKDGKILCLISDAGSPLISDPGYKLIRACQEEGVPYTSVPGASSIISGLQLSGLATDKFYFGGFLEAKDKAKTSQLENVFNLDATLIFFETANRIEKTLDVIERLDPTRKISIVREITKKFEQVLHGRAQDVLNELKQKPIKGEIVLLIERNTQEKTSEIDCNILKKIEKLSQFMPLKEVSKYLEEETGVSKKDIYNAGLSLKE